VKRNDLIKTLKQIARDQGVDYREQEGARHTKVWVGSKQTVVPRHNEVNERTAQGIIDHLKGKK
jgi:mRNA interferase HicA